MRNLKKVLALVVVMTMMFSSVAFAASFSDVAKDSQLSQATGLLSSLGVITGYEDGTFGADKQVTRAELAAMIIRMLGLESAAKSTQGTVPFTDVKAADWHYGYVQLAYSSNIINGFPDGTFQPNANVTYEQAVKMVVSALGYAPSAQKQGYPTGYLVVASQNQIDKGISVKATSEATSRGTVAQLIFNSLDVPLMVQFSFGREENWAVMDGKNGNAYKTVLSDKLKINKLQGDVKATEYTTLATGTTTVATNHVLVNLTDVSKSFTTMSTGNTEFNINGTNARDYLGYKVEFYTKENSATGYQDIIAIDTAIGKNTVTKVTSFADTATYNAFNDVYPYSTVTVGNQTSISPANNTGKNSNNGTLFFHYYANSADLNTTKLELQPSTTMIINGSNVGTVSNFINASTSGSQYPWNSPARHAAAQMMPRMGNTVFVDSDNDGKVDVALVTSYYDMTVDTVNTNSAIINNIITSPFNNSGTLNLNKTSFPKLNYSIVDKDGKSVALADLQQYDVLTVLSNNVSVDSNRFTRSKGNLANSSDYVYYNVTLTRNTATGSVEEYKTTNSSSWVSATESTPANATKSDYADNVTIAGKAYSVSKGYQKDLDLKINDNGTFYLNTFGQIAYAKTTSKGITNFGFLYTAVKGTGVDSDTLILKVVDKNGTDLKLTTVSSNLEVMYPIVATPNRVALKTYNIPSNFVNPVTGAADDTQIPDRAVNTVVVTPAAGTADAVIQPQLITYDTNSAGLVSRINLAASASVGTSYFTASSYVPASGSDYYSGGNIVNNSYAANSSTLGGYQVGKSAFVFDVSSYYASHNNSLAGIRSGDIKVTSTPSFSDKTKYDSMVYNVDSTNAPAAIVIFSGLSSNYASNVAVLTNVTTTTNSNGSQVQKAYLLVNGKQVTYNTSKDNLLLAGTQALKNGDSFLYKLNSSNEISAVTALKTGQNSGYSGVIPTPGTETTTANVYATPSVWYNAGFKRDIKDANGSWINIPNTAVAANAPGDRIVYGQVSEKIGNTIYFDAARTVFANLSTANIYFYDKNKDNTPTIATIADINVVGNDLAGKTSKVLVRKDKDENITDVVIYTYITNQ